MRHLTEEHKRKIAESNRKTKLGKPRKGFYIDDKGYKFIYNPTHPHAKNGRYILEHRLIMEKHLSRFLERKEVVHHINGNRLDNRIENLILFPSDSEHKKHHFPKGINITLSEESKIKRNLAISKAMTGKKLSEEHKKKLHKPHNMLPFWRKKLNHVNIQSNLS
jgi:hypothetical protein